MLDVQGESLGQGRIDHAHPEDFRALVRRWPGCRVVFEASMNWHWLFEILERELSPNASCWPIPSRRASLLRRKSRPTRWTRGFWPICCAAGWSQRAYRRSGDPADQGGAPPALFFRASSHDVAQSHSSSAWRQHEVKLPQCSDLFGRKGLSLLEKLELPAAARLLLAQQLALLKELAVRIREDEKTLKTVSRKSGAQLCAPAYPGMRPILAAVVVTEIDGIERFPSAQKLCGYAGLCPSTRSSAGKTFQGKLLRHCNKWLRWAFVEAWLLFLSFRDFHSLLLADLPAH